MNFGPESIRADVAKVAAGAPADRQNVAAGAPAGRSVRGNAAFGTISMKSVQFTTDR